jgi:Calx-beta domain
VAVIGTPSAATNTISDNDSATVSIAATTNGNEQGPVSAVFTVTQTAPSSVATVINLTRSGTATLTNDYTSPSNTITIPAGSLTATITYPVVNDATVEGDETLIVTMSSVASGLATLAPPTAATATIFDNDAPTVTIANTTNGTETGPANGVMTLTLSAVRVTNVTVAYTVGGTATSGLDYTALSGTATIIAGSLTGTISIPVINDTAVENAETVIVTLTSVTSGAATIGTTVVATNTIADNDSASVSITNTSNGTEAGPANGVLTITQTAVSAVDTVITYSVSGTAIVGLDYTAVSGTVTVLAGATTASISVPILNDTLYDPGETIVVTLTAVTAGLNTTLGVPVSATNIITDNDAALPALTLVKSANTAGPVVVGNLITYTYVVQNTGNTVINDINISDVHNGLGSLSAVSGESLTTDQAPAGDSSDAGGVNGTWAILAQGDTITFQATYSVIQGDIDYRQ